MICPYCQTVNRDDREVCYQCNKDLSMLRLITNKAKHHYNLAIEHAERNRLYEALAEIQNSLDLDKNNVNARVLMGTIYAKQKKMDEAIEQWEIAMSIDPAVAKAYGYIPKARKMKEAIPVFNLFRIISGVLLVCVVLIVFLLVQTLRPNPAETLLNKAINDYNSSRYGEALDKMAQFKLSYPTSPMLSMAQKITDSINKDIEDSKVEILNHMYIGSYFRALESCQKLEGFNPDKGTLQFLRHIQDEAKFSLQKSIELQLADLLKSGGDSSTVYAHINDYARFFPNDKIINHFQEQMAALRTRDAQTIQREFEQELERIESSEDASAALAALDKLNKRYPDIALKSDIQQRMRFIEENHIIALLARIEHALEKGDWAATSATLALVSARKAENFPATKRRFAHIRDAIHQRQVALQQAQISDYLKQIESAFQNDDTEQIEKLLAQKSKFHLSREELQHIDELSKLNQIKRAYAAYEEFQAKETLDNLSRLSEDEAQKTLALIPMLKDALPEEGIMKIQDRILYFSCAAHLKMGDKQKARTIFQSMLGEYPHSPYLPLAARLFSD
ncbi:MAG TPA: tetratricopeptide repeat protein [Candidatus Sumerlaeota bacterium]|nr:MAG: Tetratricopeptide repeat protein [candidate division BRC1 bacterium ADurb.Bin183]HPL74048.1 tetratricopeptide repeat protein [Candidatus Sumerlaeota bacterium]